MKTRKKSAKGIAFFKIIRYEDKGKNEGIG